jgi:hypothetical protein
MQHNFLTSAGWVKFSNKAPTVFHGLSYVTQFGTIDTTRSKYENFRVSLSCVEKGGVIVSLIFKIIFFLKTWPLFLRHRANVFTKSVRERTELRAK